MGRVRGREEEEGRLKQWREYYMAVQAAAFPNLKSPCSSGVVTRHETVTPPGHASAAKGRASLVRVIFCFFVSSSSFRTRCPKSFHVPPYPLLKMVRINHQREDFRL